MFERERPHLFCEQRVQPAEAHSVSQKTIAAAHHRAAKSGSLLGYAVQVSHDRTRVITLEAWADASAARREAAYREPGAGLYEWAGTSGLEPTPVADASAGVIVIDIFAVWRPLLKAVTAFNLRNSEAFNRQPGCISTTVLRGLSKGSIATYARWRSTDDFLRAFEATAGGKVASTDDINAWAARRTLGLIRPDYHTYELVASAGSAAA